MGVSLREYARHKGVSHTAVQKAIAAGRISTEADGTIDPRRADAEWEANTRQQANDPEPEETGMTYRKARKMRLLYEAKLLKLELDVKNGILGDEDDLCREVFNRARQVRDRLLTIPRRLGPLCAAEKDPEVIRKMLRDAFAEALGTMASPDTYIPLGRSLAR